MENNNSQIGDKKAIRKAKFKKRIADLWDLVKFALIALLIVIPVRMFIAQPFVVSGESMFPTFHNGEYLIVDELSYKTNIPHRGDVVVFRFPGNTKRFFIKRIIGMPNEKVIVNNQGVTIINKENPDGFKLNEPYVNEKLFNQTGEYTTGDNEYFVMGDNRNNSSDSRTWGILPSKLLIGRTYLRLFPINKISYLPGYYKEIK